MLGVQKCHALPIFHALTGCDVMSSFSGKGKKSAWQAWSAFPEVTTAFYPCDAMLARVFAIVTCLSICHTPVLCLAERKQDREMYTV